MRYLVIPLLMGATLLALVGWHAGLETSAEDPIDLTGDWMVTFVLFDDIEYDPCDTAIQHVGSELLIAMSCPGDTFGTLRGSLDQGSKEFSVEGVVSGLRTTMSGIVAKGGEMVTGEWRTEAFLEGTFTVTSRVDRSPSLIDLTGTWDVMLEPYDVPPPDAAYSDRCTGSIQQTGNELVANLDCHELGLAFLAGEIRPYAEERTLNLNSAPESAAGRVIGVAAPGGGFVLGVWSNHDQSLEASLRATRTAGPQGDVDCDATVNSLDAVITLQLVAGLTDSLSCSVFADLDGSDSVDSTDAALILQRSAGFLALLF